MCLRSPKPPPSPMSRRTPVRAICNWMRVMSKPSTPHSRPDARGRSRRCDRSAEFDQGARGRPRERARRRGAGGVRVVDARADAESRERMRASFGRGDLRTWAYDDAYARAAADPQAILAGARSIVCIAVPYATAEPARPPLHGRVSNYAWSPDYH